MFKHKKIRNNYSYGAVVTGLLFVVGVEPLSTGVALVVLGGVCIVSVELIEPCDSASISVDVISSMPRNVGVDDDVIGGGDDDVVVGCGGCGGGAVVVAAATAVCNGLVVRSEVGGGGVDVR